VAWVRSGGVLAPDDAAPWHQSLTVPAGFTGPVVDTREYVFLPGTLEAEVTLARTDATDGGGPIATLQALDNNSQEVLAEHALEIRAAQSGL
jgi:hypothetical protein